MKHWRFFLVVMIAVLPLFFIDIGNESKSAMMQLYGFAHFFYFALLSWCLSGIGRFRHWTFPRRAAFIMLVIICAGGSIELLQPFLGRDATWRDLRIDVLGALFGIAFWAQGRRQLWCPLLIGMQVTVVALAVIVFYAPSCTLWDKAVAARQFPVLGDFETRLEVNRWSSGVITERIARHGKHALDVYLGNERDKRYQGTTLQRSFGDWWSFKTFAFSLYNPEAEPLGITVSIRDHEHFRRGGQFNDRFNRTFVVQQGWNDISIPIGDIQKAPSERQLQLDRLSEVVIFTAAPPEPRRMYLDYVRLIE